MTNSLACTSAFTLTLFASTVSISAVAAPPNEPSAARAPAATERQSVALTYDLSIDLPVTFGAGALSLTLELLNSKLAPWTCRWCDRNSNGSDSLNGFDSSIRRALRWNNTGAADTASTLVGYGVVPLTCIGLGALLVYRDNRSDEFLIDALLVAEATLIALDVNQVSKLTFGRQRPDAHFRTPAERDAMRSPEDNLSFYSGHTTFAFALATSTATVATLRRYRLAPVVWVVGTALAATTGYLRVAADKHYASDVMTAAVVGMAIGVGVPYAAHGPTESRVTLAALPIAGGSGLMVSGAW